VRQICAKIAKYIGITNELRHYFGPEAKGRGFDPASRTTFDDFERNFLALRGLTPRSIFQNQK